MILRDVKHSKITKTYNLPEQKFDFKTLKRTTPLYHLHMETGMEYTLRINGLERILWLTLKIYQIIWELHLFVLLLNLYALHYNIILYNCVGKYYPVSCHPNWDK